MSNELKNSQPIKDTDTAQVKEVIELNRVIKELKVDEMINLFKKHSYWPNTLNKNLCKAISMYSQEPNQQIKDIIMILLNKSADIDTVSEKQINKKEKVTVLMLACMKSDLSFIKDLLIFKPNVNLTDQNGKNALMILLFSHIGKDDTNLLEIVIIMITQGKVSINAEDNLGNTALTIAVSKGLITIVNVLLKHGANIDQQVKGNHKNTAMHIAISMGNISLIKLLLSHKPNLLIQNAQGKNILEEATLKPSTEIYKIIAEEYSKRLDSNKEKDEKIKKDFPNANDQSGLTAFKQSPVNQSNLSTATPVIELQKPKESHKLSDLIQVNSINQQHRITERDLKYAKIKLLSENNKLEFSQLIKPKVELSQNNIIKKLEAEIANLADENAILRLENAKLLSEIRSKDALLEMRDDEIKQLSGNTIHNYLQQQGSQSFSGLNLTQKHLLGLSNVNKKEILEKKFCSVMYRDEYVARSLQRDLLDFQEYNKEQIRKIKPIQEELLNYIREAVAETLPEFEVRLYGSHATGLCLSWSDLDTVLIHKKGIGHITYTPSLQNLYIKILEKPWKKSIKYIDSAVIPIIKIVASEKYNNMHIDISVQDSKHYGLKCVELVKGYMTEFEALEPLLYSLKNLLKNANLNDPYTGGLSSYGLILMLVSFLQNQRANGKCIKLSTNVDNHNLGKLFLEFCWYYGIMFDHTKYVINAYPLNGNEMYQEKESLSFLSVSLYKYYIF